MIIDRDQEHQRLLAACRTYVQVATLGIPPGGESGLLEDIRTPLLRLHPLPLPLVTEKEWNETKLKAGRRKPGVNFDV